MPDALAQGADTLVSIGGYQSNHTRQVAAVAARLGMKCVLVQEKWVDWPDCVNDRVGNILLSRIMGADVRLDDAGFDIGFRDCWRRGHRRRRGSAVARRTPSRPARPTTRSAGWASRTGRRRSQQQERELGVFFDTIVVCTVTGSTHAGMIAGFAGQDRPRRVIGIDASATLDQTRDQVARIARSTAELIGLGPRPARRRDHRAGGLGRRPLRHPRAVHARRDPAHRSARRDDHRPGLRGEVDGRPDRPGP